MIKSKTHQFNMTRCNSFKGHLSHCIKVGENTRFAYTIPADGFDKLVGYYGQEKWLWIHQDFQK